MVSQRSFGLTRNERLENAEIGLQSHVAPLPAADRRQAYRRRGVRDRGQIADAAAVFMQSNRAAAVAGAAGRNVTRVSSARVTSRAVPNVATSASTDVTDRATKSKSPRHFDPNRVALCYRIR
jgi:hypothetical protein